jgi:hypothetical protein
MIGVHVKKGSFASYEDAILDACGKYNTQVVQLFVTNPRSNQAIKINHDRLAQLISGRDLHVYIHASYVCRVWGAYDTNGTSRESLHRDLRVCHQIGARGVILHLPAKVSKIPPVIQKLQPHEKLLFEPVATKIADNYGRPAILTQLPYKICVDTAHLWSMGVNVRHRPTMVAWLTDMQDRISLIHLNGSYELIGAGTDKHAVPFSKNDRIWGSLKYAGSSCAYIIAYARERGIDMIVENNEVGDDAEAALQLFLQHTHETGGSADDYSTGGKTTATFHLTGEDQSGKMPATIHVTE